MKKVLFALFIIALSMSSNEVSAQKFFDKLSKAIDKTSTVIDNVLGADTETTQPVAQPTANTSDGVVINGVTWATANVAAPGKFAATPRDEGMYYQFGIKVGWCSGGPGKDEGGVTPTPASAKWGGVNGRDWSVQNDPCPDGWRVPTRAELTKLTDAAKVKYERETDEGGGRVIGIFTDIQTGHSIVMPAYQRVEMDGWLSWGDYGGYWSSTAYTQKQYHAYQLNPNYGSYDKPGAAVYENYSYYGYYVRCVKK